MDEEEGWIRVWGEVGRGGMGVHARMVVENNNSKSLKKVFEKQLQKLNTQIGVFEIYKSTPFDCDASLVEFFYY